MKKMIMRVIALAAIFASTNFYTTAYALGCSSKIEEVTSGAACSIQELNLEKNRTVQSKVNTEPEGEKDLRPIRIQGEMSEAKVDLCQYSSCIYKTLLGR